MIHRYWSGDADPRSGDLVLAGVEVRDWTDSTVPAWLLDLADQTVWRVEPGDELRHRANIVRLGLLYEHGGWWADHDLTTLGSFAGLPSPATAQHRGGRRCNCWLAFPAGHSALEETLRQISLQSHRGRSTAVSGEDLMEAMWGDEIGRVGVRFDIDGIEDMDAPRVLSHRGDSQP